MFLKEVKVMFKQKQRLFLIITVFLSSILPFLYAEDSENLEISYCKMVFYIIANEDLADAHLEVPTSIITDDSVPVFINIPTGNNYNINVSDYNFKTVKNDKILIRFDLKNLPKDFKNYIAYEVYTLKKVSDYRDMPTEISFYSYYNLSDDLKYYTRPSLTCQSDAPEIKTKAYELIYKNWNVGNVMEIIREIINFTGNVIVYKEENPEASNWLDIIGPQTALDSLKRGYAVCIGKSNLAVALCRSLGIPARILGVFSSHFIAEIYLPYYGWVRAETTAGIFPYPKNQNTVLWISDINDENFSIGGISIPGGLEEDPNAEINVEEDLLDRIENFALVEGTHFLNKTLFDKGKELWRLFCQLKNVDMSSEQLMIFSEYQKFYFEALINNEILNALNYAELAILEAKQLLNLSNKKILNKKVSNKKISNKKVMNFKKIYRKKLK